MITIRDDQLQVFKTAAAHAFEDDMVLHVKKFTPPHYNAIGEEGTRKVVRLGFKRAERYNLTNRGPVQFYIESMFMFGSYFDTDPQYPWIEKALNDPAIKDQMDRADFLYEKMQDYLQSVAGPDNKYAIRALKKLSNFRSQSTPPVNTEFQNKMIRHMTDIYPEKCKYNGTQALENLIKSGMAKAGEYWPGNDSGTALFIGLMFGFGHGVWKDPQFPWVAATLDNPSISDPDKRTESLKARSFIYLDHVLKYFEQG
ncbi:hypothetical protein [Desulfobacter curvatus]|uniref:hypothetical protein n=1 Tax=Desulfobacter curvatus TaxID=2290 RepID=UPI00036B5221|nr:hypothetical protein [Desulfobacter curvatus]